MHDLDQAISGLLDQKDERGIIEILKTSKARGDYVLTYTPTGEKFSLLASAIPKGWTELALHLIEQGADVNKREGQTPLMLACAIGNRPVIEALIVRGAKMDVKSSKSDGETDDTALMISGEKHDAWAVKRLLEAGADPSVLNYRNQSAVHQALVPQPTPAATEVVTALLEAGCPLLGTELHYPVSRRDVAMTRLLIDRGCPLDAMFGHDEYAGPKRGETPLTTAVRAQHSDTTDAPEIGLHPTEAPRVEIVGMLLKAGADPNAPGPKGRTPLMIAVLEKHRRLLEMLLEAGADTAFVPPKTKDGSALDLARKKGADEMVALMEARPGRARGAKGR